MTEHWSKQIRGRGVLTVELGLASHPVPLWPKELDHDGQSQLALAVITYLNGFTQRYSSLEKARRILANRGFELSEQLVFGPPDVDDEPPRRVV